MYLDLIKGYRVTIGRYRVTIGRYRLTIGGYNAPLKEHRENTGSDSNCYNMNMVLSSI